MVAEKPAVRRRLGLRRGNFPAPPVEGPDAALPEALDGRALIRHEDGKEQRTRAVLELVAERGDTAGQPALQEQEVVPPSLTRLFVIESLQQEAAEDRHGEIDLREVELGRSRWLARHAEHVEE